MDTYLSGWVGGWGGQRDNLPHTATWLTSRIRVGKTFNWREIFNIWQSIISIGMFADSKIKKKWRFYIIN